MKANRYSEEQKIRILNDYRTGKTGKEICAEYNLNIKTLYAWKRKYGEMDIHEARRLKSLEEENSRLKKIVAEQTMQIDLLKEINSKKW